MAPFELGPLVFLGGGELAQADADEAAVALTAAMVAATGRKCGIVFALLQGPPRQR